MGVPVGKSCHLSHLGTCDGKTHESLPLVDGAGLAPGKVTGGRDYHLSAVNNKGDVVRAKVDKSILAVGEDFILLTLECPGLLPRMGSYGQDIGMARLIPFPLTLQAGKIVRTGVTIESPRKLNLASQIAKINIVLHDFSS